MDSSSDKPSTASPGEEYDATLSVSSDSVSLPTQVEVRPQAPPVELAQKLTEASLEDDADESREEPKEEKREPVAAVQVVTQPEVPAATAAARPSAPPSKEEGPQDLRVFELNSDSGKSTPSNNGKKGRKAFRGPLNMFTVTVGEVGGRLHSCHLNKFKFRL